MRIHQQQRESDLLSKILRRGSHATDPSDDSSNSNSTSLDAAHNPTAAALGATEQNSSTTYGGRSRKGSHYQNNNQQRPSVTGNSRFSAFFIDPLYHAIMMNKGKEDGASSVEVTGLAAYHVEELSTEESARRQELISLRFEDLHLVFDPFDGAEQEDTMDNNELESLLEQTEDNRLTLEEKAYASGDSTGDSDVDDHTPREQTLALDDNEELDFDSPSITVSVRKLMHRIQSMSGPIDDVDLSAKSNQDDDDSNEDDEAQDRDDETGCETTFENLEPVMLETTGTPTYVPSCFPQAQMPLHLTASVRRLVIDLKDDSERRHDIPQQHGFSARRRGNSCPVPIRPPSVPVVLPASTSTTPTAGSQDQDSERKRKKSTFGRLAPRLLETLNFRRKKKTFHYTDEELESIEGARWKIVELAFRFGGKHRFYLVQAINMFFPLTKYGRRGGPHPTRLHCNHCGTLQWQHKRGNLSESVDLAQVLQVFDGRQTAVFRKYATSAALEARSFSIIFSDRTLDLETQSMSHRDWLMSALRTLISYSKTQREAEERAIAERRILPLEDMQLPGNGISMPM
ncbi:hypothetical protein Gpo141_00003075 [Globisporangium polare]